MLRRGCRKIDSNAGMRDRKDAISFRKTVRRDGRIFNKDVKIVEKTGKSEEKPGRKEDRKDAISSRGTVRNAVMQGRKNAKTAGRIFNKDVENVVKIVRSGERPDRKEGRTAGRNGEKPGRKEDKIVGRIFKNVVVNVENGDKESLVKIEVENEVVEVSREWDNGAKVEDNKDSDSSAEAKVGVSRVWDNSAVVNAGAGKADVMADSAEAGDKP